MKATANRLIAASAGALLLCTVSSAQPKDSVSRSDADSRLDHALYEVAMKGTKIFSEDNNFEGCASLYEGAVRVALPFLGDRPELKKRVIDAIRKAVSQNDPAERAHTLRDAIDDIRNTIKPVAGSKNGSNNKNELPSPGVKPEKNDERKPDNVRPRKDAETPGNPNGPSDGPQKENPRNPRDNPSAGAKPPADSRSLWDRLGGERAIASIVHEAVTNMNDEPAIDLSRGAKYTDFTKLERSLVEYISSKTGGPLEYKGKDMKAAHAGMHVTDKQFNLFKGKLMTSFQDQKYHIPDVAVLELDHVIDASRKDIVEK
jgi:hemoglobin